MLNFRDEILDELKLRNKTEDDIRWIGTRAERFTSTDVMKTRFRFKYEDGYGTQNINPYLLIVGDDWWLERHEYDGAEWWEFKQLPVMPEKTNDEIEVFVGWNPRDREEC